jgi:Ribose/Galactose Isomerase
LNINIYIKMTPNRSTELTPLRIVVGSDNAGHAYKTALKETLKKHAGVAEVLDVGVIDADDSTAYPHLAVDACKKIKSGEVCLGSVMNPDAYTNTIAHRPTAPS